MSGWLVWCMALACGAGGAASGVPASWLGAAAAFDVESAVTLNDVARSDADVGYRLRAELSVAPLWAQPPDHFLLKFTLHSPQLYLRGKNVNADFMPHGSVWDTYTDTAFYGNWSKGLITEAYLDPSELPDIINYKKALLSLFQFQAVDGRYNETDVSGPCNILYETMSQDVFRKIKTECESDGDGVVRSARRVTRYTLSGAGPLRELHAEELLALGHAALGLKARSWHRLRARAPARAPAPPGALAAARRELAAAGATPHALSLAASSPHAAAQEEEEELEAALLEEEARGALGGEGAGGGGGGAQAAAAVRLLPLLRAAPAARLRSLLLDQRLQDSLPGLCRLLGLAGSRAAHAAAADFLQLAGRDPLRDLARVYLEAFALAPAPDDAAVLELLRLGEEGRAADVAESALLAAAAAARAPALAQAAHAALARSLPRCRDDACRALRLRALANLRLADGAELLLEHAERAAGPAALAALDALGAAPPAALPHARLERLAALALRDAAPLELRAAALDLLVRRRAPLPAPLARVAHALHARGPHELRRVLWQRMAALAPAHPELRALPAMLEPVLRGWDAQAHAGTSAVLARETGWALGGWRSSLQSLQVARDGLLRRGSVLLMAEDARNRTYDVLAVEVWTRGLQAFGGGGGEQEEEPSEEPAAGLALSVGGARLRELPLFHGQAELLAHVWAGTASAPTPALRALLPLGDERCDVALLGGVRLRARAGAALALALDAAAAASLWRRSARAELRLRGALAASVRAALRPAWGRVAAEARVRAEPRLRVGADLDFYSGVALCVRARTGRLQLRRGVSLEARLGARRLRVRRERAQRAPAEGRTLSLGRANDATCRTLLEADDPADADADADAD